MSHESISTLGTAAINHVTVVGGTHGNESTGVYLVKHWEPIPFSSFSCDTLLANPMATEKVQRFIDKDLNRCFSDKVLLEDSLASLLEVQRAKKIISLLNTGPTTTDYIIDLHTTTSSMGVTLIFEQANWLTFCILNQVKANVPNVHFMYEPPPTHTCSQYLISSAPQGIMIEVGPVAQGLLEAQAIEQTQQALTHTLKAIEFYNQTVCLNPQTWLASTDQPTLEVFQSQQNISYPCTSEGFNAYIHPQLQGKDYCKLQAGMPIFKSFSQPGQSHLYDGPDCYPVFINEAAYYKSGLAFTCTQRQNINFNRPVPPHTRRAHP